MLSATGHPNHINEIVSADYAISEKVDKREERVNGHCHHTDVINFLKKRSIRSAPKIVKYFISSYVNPNATNHKKNFLHWSAVCVQKQIDTIDNHNTSTAHVMCPCVGQNKSQKGHSVAMRFQLCHEYKMQSCTEGYEN